MADDVADERADDDDVVHDERRRLPPEAVDSRVVVALDQVDLAAVAEVGIALSRFCVQGDEPVTEDGQHPSVVPVRPVAEAARRPAALTLHALGRRRVVEPDHLAGGGVEGRDHPRARC